MHFFSIGMLLKSAASGRVFVFCRLAGRAFSVTTGFLQVALLAIVGCRRDWKRVLGRTNPLCRNTVKEKSFYRDEKHSGK